ncbi:bifunctional glutathione transferase/peroxidase [Lithohypha guttulata]|uniref:Bifunctional glutathione transferase/peroxidase n=1 Tax=Lithohypha guttulata TaxID=1690604 RepID=A0AAN7YLK8_9EURO|nr:bifunctional glutathione transferase/peroxidase [Lithohypha guttulata]
MATEDTIPKITLHWLEVSRAHRILWLLEELEIPYSLETYKRGSDKRADPRLKTIHPLGKSPVVTIDRKDGRDPLVLIESAAIIEYLCDHYGKWLVPARYPEGKDGEVAEETDAWIRYKTFMHYAEGSLMPLNLITLLMQGIKQSSVPFFIRPIVNGVADKVTSIFLKPNFETHFKWIESQLATSGGEYLCGKDLSAADILMSFPLEAGKGRSGLTKEDCPRIWDYVSNLYKREAYKRSIAKIEAVEGSFKSNL